MPKHDLQARAAYRHPRDSIEAHLTHRLRRTGRQPLDRRPDPQVDPEVRPHHRRYRTIEIQVGARPTHRVSP
jgi:hypothetical protein